jgi:C4-type Zn-finger protein
MSIEDNVSPAHYKQGNIETIEYILDQDMDYLEGNIIKYVSRYKFKNGLEDLKKAQWYLEKLIEEQGGQYELDIN